MRHTMLIPLQLLARSGPPPEPWNAGDMYFDTDMGLAQIFNGFEWGSITGGDTDEVFIQNEEPLAEGAELWLDVDGPESSYTGDFVPLAGGEMTGTLSIIPTYADPPITALIVASGGILVESGGVTISTPPTQANHATTKEYVDTLLTGGGGNEGGGSGYLPLTGGVLTGSLAITGPYNGLEVMEGLITAKGGLSVDGGTTTFDTAVTVNDAMYITTPIDATTPDNHVATKAYVNSVGGGGGGGVGVTDHGALNGLSDPDHPIAAVIGLQAALDGKAAATHNHDATYLKLSGGTMAGFLNAKEPEATTHVATMNYVDNKFLQAGGGMGYLPTTGGEMTGQLRFDPESGGMRVETNATDYVDISRDTVDNAAGVQAVSYVGGVATPLFSARADGFAVPPPTLGNDAATKSWTENGFARVTVSATEPVNPGVGDIWISA